MKPTQLTILAIILSLGACAVPTPHVFKAGISAQQKNQDIAECKTRAMAAQIFSTEFMNTCMESKGYEPEPEPEK